MNIRYLLPPAARNLFEKRILDFQKLLIEASANKSFCRGSRAPRRGEPIGGVRCVAAIRIMENSFR